MQFKKPNPKQSFPELEKEIISYWKENDIFKKSITSREGCDEFNFYDGPPFATGTPHYGHILAGTMKDVIPRYQTMLGKKVERRFGWDCHGLPIEGIVEKKLEIKSKKQIDEKIGTHKFNETCRANVLTYVDDWKKTVERMGRWVDMENDYKTMDTKFMESVWWVFKNLYDKGLIYEDYRVVPYSVGMSTPLSNFEVNQGYKDKQDKTITVKFKVIGSDNKYILAWTTTPWTLVANLGLAVGKDIEYAELLDKKSGEIYILAKSRIGNYYKSEEDYSIIRTYKGSCLVGYKYEPVFLDFETANNLKTLPLGQYLGKNAFSVVLGHHVTDDSGTGIVHIAPAYGEDDMIIGKEQDLGFVAHIDDDGYTCNLLEHNGVWVFDYNEIAINECKKAGVAVKIDTITHSYPHCWRTDIPLIYRAISAWYVKVEDIKDKLIEANKKINWVPENIKYGRFGKWLEQARDWNISRNRYWGSALPIWQSEDKKYRVCVGSIEELYNLNKDFGQITKVIFVRHGRTDYNDLGLMDYQNKAKLNDFGKEQSLKIRDFLKDIKVDRIYSSPLSRCIDTISPTADEKGLKINIVDDLIEVKSPDLQDKKFSCKNYKWNNGYGGGEKISEVYLRVKEAFDKIVDENKGKTIIICSHGDPIYLARQSIYGGDYDTTKYTSGLYLENNPKYGIDKIMAIDYIYTNTKKAVDLHKHFVDEIKLKHPESGIELKRIPEVLDCWFESGAMPYASKHYPFENKDNFKFPADFIAEGIDQTRGWFYTLLVLGRALFDKNPFSNVIVNGIVLAEDGKKMSKRLKNYTDPIILMDKYGADAMRFYLMNSPVVEAQDLRFSDAGVEEVVKKVILPLWNTYSFFTTYANIDNFSPKDGNIYYVRHGQTDNNLNGIVNGGNDDIDLNENGIRETHSLGKSLKASGIKFDIIISSPMTRAKHTANILNEYLGGLEIVIDKNFKEQSYGEFKGMTHDEISKKYNCRNDRELTKVYRNNSEESLKDFEKRVIEGYKNIEKKYEGKNVLIVAHGGVFRPINKYLNNLDDEIAYYGVPGIKNSKLYKLPNYKKSNPLDIWITSEFNKLAGNIQKSLDNYKLNEASREVIKFMDNLTNWYIRRSRKRFWKSEIDSDKLEAYNTLYDILIETCKVIAPYMPFVSEEIFRNLTNKESVHLELFPTKNDAFIIQSLNNDMAFTQNIVSLGLRARAKAKIRVRQPLNYIKITSKLDEYYINILKEELNIKEVKVFENDEIPAKICKPNARLIGPKFGPNVKFIISEAKAGNFKELEGQRVQVGEFVLESNEFELEFVSNGKNNNSNEILESGNGIVIALDITLNDELIKEGYARDIVRQIQEARKEANFEVDDRIKIELSSDDSIINDSINIFKDYIEKETLSTIIEDVLDFNLEKEINLEGNKLILRLKK